MVADPHSNAGHTPGSATAPGSGVPGVGHDPGTSAAIFASSWENRTKTEQKINPFFRDLTTSLDVINSGTIMVLFCHG